MPGQPVPAGLQRTLACKVRPYCLKPSLAWAFISPRVSPGRLRSDRIVVSCSGQLRLRTSGGRRTAQAAELVGMASVGRLPAAAALASSPYFALRSREAGRMLSLAVCAAALADEIDVYTATSRPPESSGPPGRLPLRYRYWLDGAGQHGAGRNR